MVTNVYLLVELPSEFESSLQDFINTIVDDTHVLGIASSGSGKGSDSSSGRRLKGETLKQYLNDLLRDQEGLLKHLNDRVDVACTEFPRLHFLSREEVMELLSVSR